MGLKTEKTNWIFLLASNGEPENRHVYDVKFGIEILVRSGVGIDDITVIIDGNEQNKIQIIRNIEGFARKFIYKSSELKGLFEKNKHDNIVLFINGHGRQLGLDSNPVITPHFLFTSLQNANNLKKGVVFLGQCFAGVFNYMPVMAREKNGKQLPPLVVLGSTGLDRSISSTLVEKEKTKYPYSVNIFFYFLFKWIEKPYDIDGDGNFNLIDAYKYIEYCVIDFYSNQKFGNLIKMKEYERSLHEAIKKMENEKTSDEEKKSIRLAIQALKKRILLYDTHQETWILNALEAMQTYF